MANYQEDLREQLRRKYEEKEHTVVKIALVGQPGAGKSSVINKLIGKNLFKSGVYTDTTVKSQEASWGALRIVDLPGYDTKQFPFEDWCKQFSVEDYDLYLFVFAGKLHDADGKLFKKFKEWNQSRKHPYFIVRNKEDDIWDGERTLEELKKEIIEDVYSKVGATDIKVYFTSCKTGTGFKKLKNDIFASGIDNVKKDKIIAGFKADSIKDLDRKRAKCLDDINMYAWAVAANALNPIPGVDVSFDLAAFYKMAQEIRESFGLDETVIEKYMTVLGPVGKQLADKVLAYLTKEGIMWVIKQVAGQYAKKQFVKYIPFVGQVVAACAGFAMTKTLGTYYIDNCFELAKEILEYEVMNNKNEILK